MLYFLEISGKWVPFGKTSSLINNTLVIHKTVGVADGWCFFLCGPVSRKIIEARVLMSREKMWAWRYQKCGRRIQINQALPSWLSKGFLICCTKRDVKGKRIFGSNPGLGQFFLELLDGPLPPPSSQVLSPACTCMVSVPTACLQP